MRQTLQQMTGMPKKRQMQRTILKWGGELTHAGVKQAVDYGTNFREMMYEEKSGGLLRLHSTYRHDLKCYTSDEGRCQKTAAAFLKGLL